MEIEIRLFATFRDYLPEGTSGFAFKKTLKKETTVGEVIKELNLPEDTPKIILIKGNHAKEGYILQDGDVVSIFPPMGGG
ncbi:MAG: MoaD/ThiS family protein [Proteobacteria bacterium]|nr:MoaD/ThiS family protein [Pseudomonadota bacterium]